MEATTHEGSIVEVVASVAALFAALHIGERWLLRNSVATVLIAAVPALLPLTGVYLQTFTWIKIWMLSIGLLTAHFVPYLLQANSSSEKQKTQQNIQQQQQQQPHPSSSWWQYALRWAMPLSLAINIAGPAAFMAFLGRWASAVVAVVLLATMVGPSAIGMDDKGMLSYQLRWEWILCYTLWNFDFVGGSFPRHHLEHIAVLGVPLLVAWKDPSRWMATRAYTLTAYIMVLLVVQDTYELGWLPSTLPYVAQSDVLAFTQALSLASALHLFGSSLLSVQVSLSKGIINKK